jgi:hypothetical protein
MGYRIECYSLNELRRVALPGAVAPALFWALPVGTWLPGELDEMWGSFTEHQGECHDYGLLLAKDLQRPIRGDSRRPKREDSDISLASVGGKLSDLIPAGAERFVRHSAFQGELPRVLVLSGGYPQPGWGVLVEWRREGRQVIHAFEDLIRRTTSRLGRDRESAIKLTAFADAARAFQHWQDMQAAPAGRNVWPLETDIQYGEEAELRIREARAAMESGKHHVVIGKIRKARWRPQSPWPGTFRASPEKLLDAQRALLEAETIAAVPDEMLTTEIVPMLPASIADPNQREAALRSLPFGEKRDVLKACLRLRTSGIVGEQQDFRSWAERTLTETPRMLLEGLSKWSADVAACLEYLRSVKPQLEKDLNTQRKQARESFHLAAGKAVEMQWELGSEFLVTFEHLCRQDGLWVKSVPWDPARMVGWKIMVSPVRLVSRVRLYLRDLQIAAQELAPEAAGVGPSNASAIAIADGSYFTDYVHHIAISKQDSRRAQSHATSLLAFFDPLR